MRCIFNTGFNIYTIQQNTGNAERIKNNIKISIKQKLRETLS